MKFQNFVACELPHSNVDDRLGELNGLLLSVKDLFDVEGARTGAGLPRWLAQSKPATTHAKAVASLINAGARLVHKTQLDELAYSLAGNNSHYGICANPVDSTRCSGGSSSGAAVSVAKYASDIGLATDTGGSIRVPASYCGLYGMRPSFGRISGEGMVGLAKRFDTVGVLTRDIKTLAKAYQVLIAPLKNQQAIAALDSLVWCEVLWKNVDPALKQYAWHKYSQFTGPKKRLNPPVLDASSRRQCFAILQAQSIWNTNQAWLSANLDCFGDDIKQRLIWGSLLSRQEIATAEKQLRLWTDHLDQWLGVNEVLILPTVPTVAPRINEDPKKVDQHRNTLLGLTSIAGLSNSPQLQLPAISIEGMPLGLSLMSRQNTDHDLIKFASMHIN